MFLVKREHYMRKYVIVLLIAGLMLSVDSLAQEPQNNEKVVTLVVNGTGQTKEEATKNALRSAIEQAFGTFVSANTEVLNDELIKDEIATVTTGNIKSYKELSVSQTSNGLYDASVQTTVSIDQLTKFAQSKGMQAELAGASFVMNMKMRELNKKNELVAMRHLVSKLKAIAQKGLYDYKIEIGDPQLKNDNNYTISITVAICENENTKAFNNAINQTLQALSLSEKEKSEYQKNGLKYYFLFGNCLRDNYDIKEVLNKIIIDNIFDYVIKDNLGNSYYFYKTYLNGTSSYKSYVYFLNREHFDHSANYYPSESEKRMYFYEFNKKEKILPIVKDGYTTGTHIAYLARDYYGNTPRNYIGTGSELNIFPTPKSYYRNADKTNYYKQEYRLIFSEEELSKLNSITIEHRKK